MIPNNKLYTVLGATKARLQDARLLNVWYETAWYVHSTTVIKAYANWFCNILSTSTAFQWQWKQTKKKVLYTTSKNIASAQCPHTQCLALCSLCLCAQKTCAQSADGRTTFSLQAFLHIDLAKNQTEMVANKPWAKWPSNMPHSRDAC